MGNNVICHRKYDKYKLKLTVSGFTGNKARLNGEYVIQKFTQHLLTAQARKFKLDGMIEFRELHLKIINNRMRMFINYIGLTELKDDIEKIDWDSIFVKNRRH